MPPPDLLNKEPNPPTSNPTTGVLNANDSAAESENDSPHLDGTTEQTEEDSILKQSSCKSVPKKTDTFQRISN